MVIMNVERNRLRTFEGWPANAAVEPQRIAKAGFFSTGLGLEVQCFCCGGKISEWNYGDQVMTRHRALDPQCPFVKNPTQSDNVPTIPGENSSPSASSSQPASLSAEGASSSSGQRAPQLESSTTAGPGSWDQRSQYRSEAARLESFHTWPIPFIVAPERLAKAGFYYLQQGDRVQCAFCSGVVGHWEAGDDPTREHRRHFPSCPLHYNVPVGNIPMGQTPDRAHEYRDTCNSVTLRELRPFSAPERNPRGGTTKQHDMNELGIHTHRGPRHPKFATVESRLRTFTDWPSDLKQTPQLLAQAGFYRAGVNDQVRCFHCDGGLRHWDPDDDPWMEHARWFSLCGYVRLVKGDEFIQQAIVQRPPVLPTSEEANKRRSADVGAVEAPHRVRDVTEQELESLMGMTPAITALQVGLDASLVKLALRRKVEQTGLPFTTSDALIEAVLCLQSNAEMSDTGSSGSSGSPLPVLRNTETSSSESEEQEDETEARSAVAQSKPPLNASRSMPILSDQQAVQPESEEPQSELATGCMADTNTKSMPHLPSGDGNTSKANVPIDDVSLEEEVRRLKEARLCKICMDEEVAVVFLPCGHLVTCVNCAPSLHGCPVCRQRIKATVRTFLS